MHGLHCPKSPKGLFQVFERTRPLLFPRAIKAMSWGEETFLVQCKVGSNVWNPIKISPETWVHDQVEEVDVIDHTWWGICGTFCLSSFLV